jgi:hypothetical protein
MTTHSDYPAALDDVFTEANGRSFANFDDVERELGVVFRQHLAAFPIGYSFSDALDDAVRLGMLVCDSSTGEYSVRTAVAVQV